jgi:hypothetical protein
MRIFSKTSTPVLGPPWPPIYWITEFHSREIKRQKLKVDLSHSSVELYFHFSHKTLWPALGEFCFVLCCITLLSDYFSLNVFFGLIFIILSLLQGMMKCPCYSCTNMLSDSGPPHILQVKDRKILNIDGKLKFPISQRIKKIILYLFTAIRSLPGGSGYFTCKQNMKLDTTKLKSGGLHEKHVVATRNLGNHLSICWDASQNIIFDS